ncbi:ABC transporter ATP-binding protein [Candidatus Hydrogenedentota bacterium]
MRDTNVISRFQSGLALVGGGIKLYVLCVLGHCVAYTSSQILMAYSNKYFVASLSRHESRLLVLAISLRILGLALMALIYPVFTYYAAYIMQKALAGVHARVFEQVVDLPKTYFDKTERGAVLSLVMDNLEKYRALYDRYLPGAIDAIVWGLGSTAALFFFDVRLACLGIAVGTGLSIVLSRFSEPLRVVENKIQDTWADITVFLDNALSGIVDVRVYGFQSRIRDEYRKLDEVFRLLTVGKGTTRAGMNAVSVLLGHFSVAGVLVVGALMATKGLIDIADVVGIISLQSGLAFMFLNLGKYYSNVQESLVGADRIRGLLAVPREEALPSGGQSCAPSEGRIVFSHVSFAYDGGERVLEEVDFSIELGKSCALVGASGSGKSTIFNLLLGFYPCRSGMISVLGKPLDAYAPDDLRRLFAHVPQEPFLFAGTIEDNIRLGRPDATLEEIEGAARTAAIHDFIVGLDDGYRTDVAEGSTNLSGGQKQRIAIARAALRSSPFILLDEATSALDPETEHTVLSNLESPAVDKTVVIITHRLYALREVDAIYLIRDKRLYPVESCHELPETLWGTASI